MTELAPDITAVSVMARPAETDLRRRPDRRVLDRMRGPVFEQALTPAGFAAVTVDGETGTIVWPGGADLAPDTLYE